MNDKISQLAAKTGITDEELVDALRAAFATKAPKDNPTFTGTARGAALNFTGTGNFGGLLTLLAGLDVTGTTNFKGSVSGIDPTAAQDFVTLSYLNRQLAKSGGVPPGTLIHYAGRTVPSGWLIANGANVSRKDYAALFAAIGTTYGAGDGSTTFGLPNLNGRFLEGTTSTSEVGTYKSAGLPNITGSLFCDTNEAGNGLVFRGEGAHIYSVGSETYSYATYKPSNNVHIRAKIDFSAGASSSVYGGSSTVQPSAMASLVLIKF